MTVWFLILLGLAWVAVFLPAAVRAKETAPLSTTERFKRRMTLIAPVAAADRGRYVFIPESTDGLRQKRFQRTQQRRRRILVFLLWSTTLSLGAALLAGGALWNIHLALAGSLAVYVVLLIGTRRQREEAAAKVRFMESRRGQVPQEVVFHEPLSVSGGSSS